MANIPVKPWELPAATPVSNASIVGGNGSVVQKYTPAQIVDVATPLASQEDAESGTGNSNRMSALRVKQAIDARGYDAAIAARATTADLASTDPGKGASLIGKEGGGTLQDNATPSAPGLMSISDKIKADRTVDLKSIGAQYNNDYDNAQIFEDAVDALGERGGIINIGRYGNLYTSDNITLPLNFQLVGDWYPAKPRYRWDYFDFCPSMIVMEKDKTVLASGSLTKGILFWMADIEQDPQGDPAFYDNLAKYAGVGWTANGDDASVQDCMFIGFNTAMLVDGFHRPIITGNIFDCWNGIEVAACGDFRGSDVSYNLGQAVYIQSKGGAWETTIRPGKAISFHDTVDFLTCSGNKSYGYMTGLHLKNVSSIHASHTSDGPGMQTPEAAAAFAGSRGVHIEGIISNSKLFGCHVDGYDFGYAFDNSVDYPLQADINTCGACITSHMVFGPNSSGDFGQMQLAGTSDTPLNFGSGVGYWQGNITSYTDSISGNMIYMADTANDANKIRNIQRTQVGSSYLTDTIGSLWRSEFAALPGTTGKPPVREGDRAIVTDSVTANYGALIAGGGSLSCRAIYFNGAWVVGG